MNRVGLIGLSLLLVAACAAGIGDEGDGDVAASSASSASASSGSVVGYASYVVRHGRNEMGYEDPMPEFLSDEVDDDLLVRMLDWLREAPHPTDGEGLYVRFCGNCHGVAGVGGRADKDVAGEDLNEVEETIRKGHGDDDYGDRKEYMPAWPATELSNVEVAAIAAYLASLPGGGDDD